jgi:hypothetical protein
MAAHSVGDHVNAKWVAVVLAAQHTAEAEQCIFIVLTPPANIQGGAGDQIADLPTGLAGDNIPIQRGVLQRGGGFPTALLFLALSFFDRIVSRILS